METMRPTLVAAVLSVTFVCPIAGALPGEGQRLADFRARCVFADGSARLDPEESEGLFDRLQAHADGHGWQWESEEPDFVDRARTALCPVDVVDALEKSAREQAGDLRGDLVLRLAAHAAQRNGRVDEGLQLLSRALEDARSGGEDRRTMGRASDLAEHATRLAARAGRWEAVLEFAEGWSSETGCGNCTAEQLCNQRVLVARSLFALGRFEEAITVVRDTVASDWTRDVRLIEMWIDCEMALKRTTHVEEAVRSIRAELPDADWSIDRALESWRVAHATRETQIERLDVLARSHRELALPLIVSLDATQVSALLSALDVGDKGFRHPELAECLAQVGFPTVGEKLAAERARMSEDDPTAHFDYVERMWRAGNRRWGLLTHRR
jgi:hypothetical protein